MTTGTEKWGAAYRAVGRHGPGAVTEGVTDPQLEAKEGEEAG